MAIKENIVKLNVSVNDVHSVDVSESFGDLLENKFCVILLQPPSLSHVIQQIASSAQFHHKDHMLFHFESLVELNHVGVSKLF